MKKYSLLIILLAGCGGGGVQNPGPFDGEFSGVEEPHIGPTSFLQMTIKGESVDAGHVTEQDHFVDHFKASVQKDGALSVYGVKGTMYFRLDGHLMADIGNVHWHLLRQK